MKVLFKPRISAEALDIFGEKYARIVSDPNVFVLEDVKTELMDTLNAETVTFDDASCRYTLENVVIHKKGNKVYLECSKWTEELI